MSPRRSGRRRPNAISRSPCWSGLITHRTNDDLWVEIYALRELEYHKLMVKARVTPRPFFNLARRKAVPPLNY